MSAAAVGIFAGGVLLGATGAYLIRPHDARLPTKISQDKPLPSASNLDLQGYSPSDQRVIGPGGYPGPISDFLRHAAYISSYDRRLRHPSWTAEHLTAASLAKPPPSKDEGDNKKPDRKYSVFHEDDRIPLLFRARLADYFRSGYDRGHMVPAADAKISQEALNETFLLSNMCPQVGEGFNRDYWAHFEDFTRRLVGSFGNVYVFTVPLYLPRQTEDGKWRVSYEVIGDPPNISVPTHFAKVIYAHGRPELPPPTSTSSASTALSSRGDSGGRSGLLGLGTGSGALGAFVMPNAVIPNEAPLKSFVVPIESVERAAGLALFPPAMKSSSRALCDAVDCQIIVRDFTNRNRNQQQEKLKASSPP